MRQSRERSLGPRRELAILWFAAIASDLRRQLSQSDLQKAPSLAVAFVALEAVWQEMGWANQPRENNRLKSRKR
jgi:hypothetical protein